jgi:hypothetical protein
VADRHHDRALPPGERLVVGALGGVAGGGGFLGSGPERQWRPTGQVLGTQADQVGHGRVDLDDGPGVRVEDVEGVLQRVDQRAPPGRLVVAQPGQLQVGPHARQQVVRGERLGQVVVGAGLQPLDRGPFPRPRRQQHHRHRCGGRVGPQGGEQPEPVEARHHHVGQDEIRAVRPGLGRARPRRPRRSGRGSGGPGGRR